MEDDISKLLKEAKPLYFARKRRNNRMKVFAAMLVGVTMLGSFYPKNDGPFDSFDYYFMGSEIAVSENLSVIEEMGLPTDDFGLLMVG